MQTLNKGETMICPSCSKEIPDGSGFCNLCGKATQVNPRGNAAANSGRFVGSHLLPILGVILLGWLVLRLVSQNGPTVRQTTQAVAAIVNAPVTLKDEVQNLPAASWKALPLNLPYNGDLDVELRIVQGNPLDVFLTTSDQLDLMKRAQWNQIRAFTDFNAVKTREYRRTGQLQQGSYYLVMRDNSLGILSSKATDISVKVELKP